LILLLEMTKTKQVDKFLYKIFFVEIKFK